jgi:hypothetical protein
MMDISEAGLTWYVAFDVSINTGPVSCYTVSFFDISSCSYQQARWLAKIRKRS